MWLAGSTGGGYGVLGKNDRSRGEEKGSKLHLDFLV